MHFRELGQLLLRNAWKLAIETLGLVELQKLSERMALTRISKALNITDASTIRYAYGLVVETIRRKNLISKFIQSVVAPKTMADFPLDVSAFLQLYVYHMRLKERLPTVDIKSAESLCNLARAIVGWQAFRSVERYLGFLLTQQIQPLAEKLTDEERIALVTYQPIWFVKYCFNLLGRHDAISFLEGSIFPPPLCIRLNTLQTSEENIRKEFDEQGLKLERIASLRYAFTLDQVKKPLRDSTPFKNGLFFLQDKASCYAVEAANPATGQTVLDVCAAPGSKTTYLGQLMQNQGKICSLDYSRRRLETWAKEVDRMGVKIAEPIIGDACSSLPFNIEADIALLDPPCTSTGVFGRQPSAKWRLTPKSIERMAGIQWRMINSVAEKVKRGGILVYSTCSVTVEENEMILERFLKWHPEFRLMAISPELGLPGLRGFEKCRRLYPHLHGCNGFFVSKMVKLD
jgi:16S rRNA (cytosine967-C5)-methyltransferase